jgi:hypothetical protein
VALVLTKKLSYIKLLIQFGITLIKLILRLYSTRRILCLSRKILVLFFMTFKSIVKVLLLWRIVCL